MGEIHNNVVFIDLFDIIYRYDFIIEKFSKIKTYGNLDFRICDGREGKNLQTRVVLVRSPVHGS